MSACRRRAILVALCLACTAFAACGRESTKTSSVPAKATKSANTAKKATATIDAPADGARIKARETKSGAWIVSVDFTGKGAPNSEVFLRAACRPHPCLTQATTAADGTWSASLKLRTKPAQPFVPIDVGSDAKFAGGSAVVTLELYGPRTVLAQSGPSQPKENRATKKPTQARPHSVLLIGDSLSVGMEAPLKAELQGWRVEVDALKSRPLAAGMRILQQHSKAPAILAFTLFTNDDPRNVSQLESAVRATATRSGGCAVWGTIVRPPYNGTSYDAANRKLKRLARQDELALGLQIADWAGAVASEPSLLAGDGVHATPAGFAAMAKLYADAIRACAGDRL